MGRDHKCSLRQGILQRAKAEMDQRKMHWLQCPDRKIQEAWRGGGAALTYAAAIKTRILMRADTWPLGKPTHLIGTGAPNTAQQILSVKYKMA